MARTESAWQEVNGSYLTTQWAAGRDILINGTNKYLNFGSISGESGYGFRDSGGTMQVKNSGGSWSNFSSGAGTGTVDTIVEGDGVTVDDTDPANPIISVSNRVINSLSTGLVEGGQVTINADTTKFDVAAGHGVIVDNYTDPDVPVLYEVSWSTQTAVTATYLATDSVSYVLVDNTGTLVQLDTYPTDAQHRDYLFLAQLGHTNLTAITTVINAPEPMVGPSENLRDLVDAVGIISSGNVISANGANLNINKSAGTLRYTGINYHTDDKTPNRKTMSSATAPSIRHRTQTGEGGASTSLDVGYWDVGGTRTALSGTKYTNMRVFLTVPGNIVVQYGQAEYSNQSAAIAGLTTEQFVLYPNLEEYAALVGIIVVRSTATALNDSAQAIFLPTSKFGEVTGASAGISTTTLQNAYNNSTDPEILTDATRGAFSVRRGSAADTDNVIEGLNNASTVTFGVNGNGRVNSASMTASEIAGTDASKNIVSLPVATYPSLTELAYVKGVTSAVQTQINTKYTRSVVVTSGSATMGSASATDYVYMVAGAHTMSLPAASGNTNRYTVKNNHSANITIDTAGAETVEGAASISIAPEESVDIISDGTNFRII